METTERNGEGEESELSHGRTQDPPARPPDRRESRWAVPVARIAGVTRSGLFVRLKDTGADGFVPISTLGSDFFHHVEAAHALVGARTGLGYRLGDDVRVRLVEAIPSAGALRFEMLSPGRKGLAALAKGHVAGRSMRRPPRGRRRG